LQQPISLPNLLAPKDVAMGLAVPLRAEQIEAASRIHERLSQWRAADAALRSLADCFPAFEADACLLKCVTVNSLYGTNVYAILRMAAHVRNVMNNPARPTDDVVLVERLAELPAKDGETHRNFISFASKFAHFFVSPQIPIYDSFAVKMLKYHLATRRGGWDKRRPFKSFANNLQRLRDESGLTVGVRQLDHYLWLAGQCRARDASLPKGGKNNRTNRELAEVLRDPPPELVPDFAALRGDA
jgi:hypothetical protein